MNSSIDNPQGSARNLPGELGSLAAHALEKQLRLLRFAEMCEQKTDLLLLLECFYSELAPIIHFDGLAYTPPDEFETLSVGRRRQQRLSTHLNLGGTALGQLTLQSAVHFTPRDERELEAVLPGFLYPLKRALEGRARLFESWMDPLTGMNNNGALSELLPREMMLSRDADEPLSLLMIDLDYFRKINDCHGHEVGDQLILAVSDTLSDNLRSGDIIFRLNSDRFVVILSSTDFDDASLVSERLRTCMERCFSYENVQLVQNASAGVTEMVDEDTSESMLARAESALINAKQAGRNRLRFLAATEQAT